VSRAQLPCGKGYSDVCTSSSIYQRQQVLDDVWNATIAEDASFLDQETPSRLLISTRLRGLLPGATEVKISVMSLQDSVEMLVSMASIVVDASSTDPELTYICHLAGRLPLTLSICAGMIKRFGSNWKSDLLDLLREDKIGALDDEVEGGLTPSERIVARSVNELPTDASKELFVLFGLGIIAVRIYICSL
jgi:hypothetical protein